MGGFSEVDALVTFLWPGGPGFCRRAEEQAQSDIPVVLINKDVNDPEFSAKVAQTLLEMLS
jgi:hypothetical protein